jgi:hypothetical protein
VKRRFQALIISIDLRNKSKIGLDKIYFFQIVLKRFSIFLNYLKWANILAKKTSFKINLDLVIVSIDSKSKQAIDLIINFFESFLRENKSFALL